MQHGSAYRTVSTASSQVNGKWQILTHSRIETIKWIVRKFGTVD